MTSAELRDLPEDRTSTLAPLLRALWHEARGHWSAAHELAQDIDTRDGAWVHAYLHRREGDSANAAYWYRRAGKPVCVASVQEEWHSIATALLAGSRA